MSKTFKAMIIDDELRARQLLAAMISELAVDITIVAQSEDLPNGVKAIRKHRPDLVFLDIEMPGHSGLELLEFFNEEDVDFNIIFTTAYSNYAIQAFKLSAIDYLLKPIEQSELLGAIERFRKMEKGRNHHLGFSVLRENLNADSTSRIAVPSGNSIKFIELDTILYLKAEGSYTEIHFTDGTRLVVSRTLKNFEDIFSEGKQFIRCHKSFVVNIACVKEYVKGDGGYLLMSDNAQISVSAEKVEEIVGKMRMVKR